MHRGTHGLHTLSICELFLTTIAVPALIVGYVVSAAWKGLLHNVGVHLVPIGVVVWHVCGTRGRQYFRAKANVFGISTEGTNHVTALFRVERIARAAARTRAAEIAKSAYLVTIIPTILVFMLQSFLSVQSCGNVINRAAAIAILASPSHGIQPTVQPGLCQSKCSLVMLVAV
jgi:hypothetical protein